VALIAATRNYRAHEEREIGFLSLMDEMFPAIRVVGLREGQDDGEKNRRETRKLLEQFPDIAGIYNIGGRADGVAMALKDTGLDQKVVFVGHGLTPDTRSLLIDGTMDAVLTQPPLSMVMNSVRIFCNLREKRDPLAGIKAMRISVIFRENLP
jgi:LacI family transcriptional regulator